MPHLLSNRKKDGLIILHGLLHIKIIRAKHLRNKDSMRGLKLGIKLPNMILKDLSDPYVTVEGSKRRFAKSRTIQDDLNPIWNEVFYVPIAHKLSHLVFSVKDKDFGKMTECLGKYHLDVNELVKIDEKTSKLERVGIHKIVFLDGKEHYGSLEFFVEFVPQEMISGGVEVPGVYFHEKKGNKVNLYVNADDGPGLVPDVKYGGPRNNHKTWIPRRLWKDTYDAICNAKHLIYITGLGMNTKISFLRGKEREEALNSRYSPYIGELLKQKADEGVRVNVLIWDDTTSGNFLGGGMAGYHDEETKRFFANTKVNFKLSPMQGDESNTLDQKIGKGLMFTHHGKLIVLDTEREDDPKRRELLAFVGGVDLMEARWDNRNHSLFRTLGTDHRGDAYNGMFAVNVDEVGPREPWHDIHSSVRGPAVLDVLKSFQERWYKQAPEFAGKLIQDMYGIGLMDFPVRDSGETWCTQLLRSIDARTADFDKAPGITEGVEDIAGVQFQGDDMTIVTRKRDKVKNFLKGTAKKGIDLRRSFEAKDARNFKFSRTLDLKKGRDIDSSIHTGYIHHIRRADHFVYLENQYFMGSCQMWSSQNSVKCDNLVPSEIVLKIIQKIEKNERFAAYIVLPMWPEGIPTGSPVTDLLHWQHLTMEAMYKSIASALKGQPLEHDIPHPKDYLNFYCLGTRETGRGSTATAPPKPNSNESVLNNTRRHPIYVHSKMMIVDDAVSLIGSANINQRSLDGTRDSEIVQCAYQPAYQATSTSTPKGDVHGFRMHCWATVTGSVEETFQKPGSLECVRRINAIAHNNWNNYIGEDCCDMESHLLPYPIEVTLDGTVLPKADLTNGCFPDTKGKVTGKQGLLPVLATT